MSVSQNVVCGSAQPNLLEYLYQNAAPESQLKVHESESLGEGPGDLQVNAPLQGCLVHPLLEEQAHWPSQELTSEVCEFTFPTLVPSVTIKAAILALTFFILYIR